jgi:3-dehydroquinate synthetase
MNYLSVNSGLDAEYRINFSNGVFCDQNLLAGRDANSRNCLVVVDEKVYDIYSESINRYFSENTGSFRIFHASGGEENKTVNSFMRLFDAINDYPLNRRNEPLVIMGGGVVTDVAAFAASCFRRGIPHIKVPTTLMGYVDAAIGIKNGINYGEGKNRMGTFCPPLSVVLDCSFINSQSSRDISNGVAEIIKICVIKNHTLFVSLEEHVVNMIDCRFQSELSSSILRQSIVDMLGELEPNLYEQQLDRLADFGHTFSLAFEIQSKGKILHGEAVAMDIVVSCQIAYQRGLMTAADFNRVFSLIRSARIHLDLSIIEPDQLWGSLCERILHRNGLQRVPLPDRIGHGRMVNDLTYDEICAAARVVRSIEYAVEEN